MKALAVVLTFFYGVLTFAECPNLSGDYSINFDPIGRENVTTIVQSQCDSVAVGLYKFNHQTGLKEDESVPVVFYVSEGHQELCPSDRCTIIKSNSQKIWFQRNGSVGTNDTVCNYDHVEWSLDNSNLKQTYVLNDARPQCIQVKLVEKTLRRFN